MSSGRNFLAEIERALTQSRQQYRSVDLEMQQHTASLARSRRREASIYQRMARRRLADIDEGTFKAELDKADRLAGELLSEREQQLQSVEQKIDSLDARIAALADARIAADDRLVAAEEQLEALLARVDHSMQSDPEFTTLAKNAQQALNMAAAAEEKTAEANAKREEKRTAFESDPLFMYLWDSGYGTERYKAGFFARFMDRMVARHTRYERARQTYYMLHEIPRRLAAHTGRLEEKAANAAVALADYERSMDLAAGAEQLEQAVQVAIAARDSVDADIEGAEQEFAALIEQRDTFANGEDPLFRQAMTVLKDQFRAEPIPQLRREARLTEDREDDAWVDELDELREEQQRLERYIDDHSGLHEKHAARVSELAAIRSRYKERGFDAFNSRIDSGGGPGSMLNDFMHGLVTAAKLWRTINHSQKFDRVRQTRRYPGRKSGGFGGVRVPRMPRSVRIPRSIGRSGGGGFRTKSGF